MGDTANASLGTVAVTKKRSYLVDICIRLLKEKPLGTVGAIIVLVLSFTGILADLLGAWVTSNP